MAILFGELNQMIWLTSDVLVAKEAEVVKLRAVWESKELDLLAELSQVIWLTKQCRNSHH